MHIIHTYITLYDNGDCSNDPLIFLLVCLYGSLIKITFIHTSIHKHEKQKHNLYDFYKRPNSSYGATVNTQKCFLPFFITFYIKS